MDQIKPYWRNPRNNKDAVEPVRKSIEKYGYRSPIIVDQNHTIIVGHTRYKALKLLGYTEAAVIVSDMNEKAAREYRIMDNKTSEKATWDKTLLIPELRAVDLKDFFDDFPDLNIQAVNMDFTPPSENDILKSEEKHDNHFNEVGQDRAGRISDVIVCPECGHEFELL